MEEDHVLIQSDHVVEEEDRVMEEEDSVVEEEDSVMEGEEQVEGEDRNNETLGPAQNCQNWSKLSDPSTVAWMRSLGEV